MRTPGTKIGNQKYDHEKWSHEWTQGEHRIPEQIQITDKSLAGVQAKPEPRIPECNHGNHSDCLCSNSDIDSSKRVHSGLTALVTLHRGEHVAHGLTQTGEDGAADDAVADVQFHEMRHGEKCLHILVV